MKRGKRHMTEGMELTNQEKSSKINLQIFENIGSDQQKT